MVWLKRSIFLFQARASCKTQLLKCKDAFLIPCSSIIVDGYHSFYLFFVSAQMAEQTDLSMEFSVTGQVGEDTDLCGATRLFLRFTLPPFQHSTDTSPALTKTYIFLDFSSPGRSILN